MRKALEHSPTKEKLMSSAQALILSKGFFAATVEDICRSAKVTKGSFFHYFDSKEALGLELLNNYCSNTEKGFTGCCSTKAEPDPLKRVYSLIDFMIEQAGRMGNCGCLLGGMSQEMADTNDKVRKIADSAFTHMASGVERELALAIRTHKPKTKFSAKELAQYLVSTLQGGALLAKVQKDPGVAAANLRHYKNYLKSLFGK